MCGRRRLNEQYIINQIIRQDSQLFHPFKRPIKIGLQESQLN